MAASMGRWVMSRYLICVLIISTVKIILTSSTNSLDVFSSMDVLSSADNACLVLLTEFASRETSAVFHDLATDTFKEELQVKFGMIEVTHFSWPNGQSLFSSKSDLNRHELLVFQRRVVDRTCLLMNKTPPFLHPVVYSSVTSHDILIDFINTKCHTFRSRNGGLNIEGMHRQEILKTLFSMSHVSDVTVSDLYMYSQTADQISPKDIVSELNSIPYTEVKACTTSDCLNMQKDSCPVPLDNQLVHGMKTCDISNKLDKEISIPKVETPVNIPKCSRISLPTEEEFFHEYLKISKPVIIENITKSWPAFHKWTNEYFRAEYGKNEVHIKLTPGGEFEGVEYANIWENYKDFEIPEEVKVQLPHPELVVVRPATLNMNFSDFLDMIENVTMGQLKNVSAYLEYSSIPQHLPDLEKDIMNMPFLKPGGQKLEHLNIWLSDGNTLGKLHFDPYDNFLCQIHGQKQVILFEPHDNRKLYESHIPEAILSYNQTTGEFRRRMLMDSTSMVMSPVDILKPDFEKFPLFGNAQPLNCTLEEGDVLFMPSFWWHEVQSFPNKTARHNLAVNFWYDPFLTKEFPCPECRLDVNPRYRHLL